MIKRIKIENVKGKNNIDITFNNLHPNMPNILVAPNGFGKSTIATAFKAAKHGKIKLNNKDIYQSKNNHPKLEIEFKNEINGVFIATDKYSNLSNNITIEVINCPIYAKNTTKRFGNKMTSTADLRIEDIIIFEKIPKQVQFGYNYRNLKTKFQDKGKLFLNILEMISNYENFSELIKIKQNITRCITQKKIQKSFKNFLDECSCCGSSLTIKQSISETKISELAKNKNVEILFNCINNMLKKPNNWLPIDVVFTAIQLCIYFMENKDAIQKNFEYKQYQHIKDTINHRLSTFDTTGREIRAHEEKGKLIVRFNRADSLSNGERDILSFLANITKFECTFKKQVGILIIDDIFDYLDGSNMLAVQYYLIELIKKCKDEDKFLYPIIFTHLDPAVFSNYYFKKMKIHYISNFGNINLHSDLVKMLELREGINLTDEEKENIEKYYLHYNEQKFTLKPETATKISSSFNDDNISFRNKLYNEVQNNYLPTMNIVYDPIMVIAGLRIKIEEIFFNKLEPAQRNEYINTHKVSNKLKYVIEHNIDVPEIFFLLQPLYNDGMHLRGGSELINNKIKSAYLKTNNMHIRMMINTIFTKFNNI